MSTKNIRFLLAEIELYYDGDKFVPEGKSGRVPYNKKYRADKTKFDNIVEAKLEYPRSGTALVTTTKTMDLPSRRLVKLDTTDFWESGLFKEDIDSETRFTLTVSDRDFKSPFVQWFRNILSAIFKTAAGPQVSAVSNIFQGAVASDLQTKLVEGIKGNQKKFGIKSLCASRAINIEFRPNGVKAYHMRGASEINVLAGNEMTVDLFATETFKIVRKRRRSGTKTRESVTEVKFRKGDKLGLAKVILVGA